MDKKKYIQTVTEQIRCKRALPLVTKELEGHIEDQKSDYMKAGMNAEEAEEAAVLEMGDPVEVGVEMDRIHRPKDGLEDDRTDRDFESGRNCTNVSHKNKHPGRCRK